MTRDAAPRVVVLGAGYAGLTAAKVVARRTKGRAAVTLINERYAFHERMRNYQIAAGRPPREIPIRNLLRGAEVDLTVGRVTRIDTARRLVELADGSEPVGYDQLIYALGSHADLDRVPGASEHAMAVATAEHARRVDQQVGRARTVAVVGGGFTGIETVTALAEAYPDRNVSLVTRGQPGSLLNDQGREHLLRTCDRLGIDVRTDAAVAKVGGDSLLLEDGDELAADAVVWTTGFAVPALARQAGLAVDHRGRMLVDETLRSVSHSDVYGVGDAAVVRSQGKEVRMGCGPGGIAGVIGAFAVADRLADRTPRPYRYTDQALHVSLGRRDAIVQFGTDDSSRIITGRLAAFVKERVALRGSVFGIRHVGLAAYSAKRY